MSGIMSASHYNSMAKYWQQRFKAGKLYLPKAQKRLEDEYLRFTDYLYETNDNFRISTFDAVSGYIRKE